MNSLLRFFFSPTRGPASIVLIRLPVGLIFFTQGILKFTDPNMGVVRFARIGFSHPYFTAHFVGDVRDRVRPSACCSAFGRGCGRSAVDGDHHGDRDDEDPGAVSRQSGPLVHGQRRAHGFRDVLLAALPDFRRWWSLVARCAARRKRLSGRIR